MGLDRTLCLAVRAADGLRSPSPSISARQVVRPASPFENPRQASTANRDRSVSFGVCENGIFSRFAMNETPETARGETSSS